MCPLKMVVWEQVLGVRPGCKWSHHTPTANNTGVRRPALPMQTPAPQMTTSLWKKETVCVCVIVLSVAWGGAGGHLGFLQPAKQMQSGRFTSPSGQAENIHTVGHSTKKTLPKEMKRFLDICLWSRSKPVTVSLDPVTMAKSQNGRSALQ